MLCTCECVCESVHVFEATEVKVRLLVRLMFIVSGRSWLSCSSRVMEGIMVWFWVKVRLKLKFRLSLGLPINIYLKIMNISRHIFFVSISKHNEVEDPVTNIFNNIFLRAQSI